MRIVVPGTFDLFHKGHKELFDYAEALGTEIVSLVNSDEYLKQRKEPSQNTRERITGVLENNKDRVVKVQPVLSAVDFQEKMKSHAPCICIHGNDWTVDSLSKLYGVEREWWLENNILMIFKDRYPGVSSSRLRKELPKRKTSDFWMHPDLKKYVTRRCDEYPGALDQLRETLFILTEDLKYDAASAFGTLLGLIRDEQLIPHDTDIDINIYANDPVWKQDAIIARMKKKGYFLVLKDTYQLVFAKEEGVIVDICYFTKCGDGKYRCPHQVKEFVLSQEAKDDPYVFLEEVYGDWETPIGKEEPYLHGEGAK